MAPVSTSRARIWADTPWHRGTSGRTLKGIDDDASTLFREARRLLASRAYERAIDRLDVQRPPEWAVLDALGARTLRLLGQAYLGLSNPTAAADCLEQLRTAQKGQQLLPPGDYAAALTDLLKCYRCLGKMEAAEACQDEARQLL